MESIKIDKNYDISFDDSGDMSISNGTDSLIDRLTFDFESNLEWQLRRTLGLDWINEYGTGFLQDKNSIILLNSFVSEKLSNYNEIKNIVSIDKVINKIDRSLKMFIKIDTIYGMAELEVNV